MFTSDETYKFDANAESDIKICTLDKEAMDKIIMSNPKISLKLLQLLQNV